MSKQLNHISRLFGKVIQVEYYRGVYNCYYKYWETQFSTALVRPQVILPKLEKVEPISVSCSLLSKPGRIVSRGLKMQVLREF